MKMKKFLIALEEQVEAVVDESPEKTVEESVLESDNEVSSIQQQQDAIVEADSALETTEVIEENIEAAVTEDDGLDKTSTVVTAAALEHFYQRFSFNPKQVMTISNESFKTKENRLETTKVILENLKVFNTKLEKQIGIAKEGLGRRFANSIKMIFTAEKKITARITDDVAAVKGKGVKSDVLKEPGWGRSFAVLDSGTVTGSDVIKYMTTLDSLFKNDIDKYVEKINTILTKVIGELNRGQNQSTLDKAFKELTKVVDEIEKFDESFKAKYGILETKKNDPDFKPLTVEEVIKLGNTTLSVLKNTQVNNAIDELFETTWNNWMDAYSKTEFRKDIVTSMTDVGLERLSRSINILWDSMVERKRICFAASNYIRASLA